MMAERAITPEHAKVTAAGLFTTVPLIQAIIRTQP